MKAVAAMIAAVDGDEAPKHLVLGKMAQERMEARVGAVGCGSGGGSRDGHWRGLSGGERMTRNSRTIRTVFWDLGGVVLTNGWDLTQRTRVLGRLGVDLGRL